jgi:mannose/cellobiose epimerase-like protein (N-acyl-D-glucosamine 2-epimerase family)
MLLSRQRDRTRAFIETALRRWSTAGFDSSMGVFEEALDYDGTTLEGLPRRGRVQARQIYTYALAHRYGFDPAGEYLQIAETASRTGESIYRRADGGWIFSADPQGAVVNDDSFAYEQSFRIMSLAALSRATKDPEYSAQAEESWQWIESVRHQRHGGFDLGSPNDPGKPREQNPHMHLFEACIEAAPIDFDRWVGRADEIFRLAMSRFISPDGALIEFFQDDWSPDPATGADIQPGHHFEWVWLLTQFAKQTGADIPAISTLYGNGVAWGLDGDGLGLDEVRPGGRVLRGTKRLWVQCEVLKGHLARYETTREPLPLLRAQNVLDNMFDLYLIERNGVWRDQLDEHNVDISTRAPASSFYHVIVALNEFLRVSAV